MDVDSRGPRPGLRPLNAPKSRGASCGYSGSAGGPFCVDGRGGVRYSLLPLSGERRAFRVSHSLELFSLSAAAVGRSPHVDANLCAMTHPRTLLHSLSRFAPRVATWAMPIAFAFVLTSSFVTGACGGKTAGTGVHSPERQSESEYDLAV